ncbi:MAG: hypothetical protein ABJF23_33490 [Bryobacteraceae bacterium]
MSLFPTPDVTECLPAVSSTVREGAELLQPLKGDWPAVERQIQVLQECAARHKASLFNELCHTLITPLDPEDLFQLSGRMISTLDEIAASSELFLLWFPVHPPASLVELCALLTEACTAFDDTLSAFLRKKLDPAQFRDFPRIRARANQIVNSALAELFDTETDTNVLLRKRELYKHPHAAVVRCCEAATALRSIALKNG